MNKKDLTDLGVAEDIAEKIIVLHGKDIEAKKADLTAKENDLTALKGQLEEANKQIESFKGLKVEEIQKAADEYKAKYEQSQKDAQAQLAGLKFDHSLESALASAKAKNPIAVKALLNKELLKLNDADGSIVGLAEQLQKIKSENDYLFESDTPEPKIVTSGNGQKINMDSVAIAARKGAGLPIE